MIKMGLFFLKVDVILKSSFWMLVLERVIVLEGSGGPLYSFVRIGASIWGEIDCCVATIAAKPLQCCSDKGTPETLRNW